MKTKDVINKTVLILMLMVIIISTPLCKIIIYLFFIPSFYITASTTEDENAKQDVIEAVFYDDEYCY